MSSQTNEYLLKWELIAQHPQPAVALEKHFSFLVDSPGFEPALSLIMKAVKRVDFDRGALVLYFNPAFHLVCHPPAPPDKYRHWPLSFQQIMNYHELITSNTGLFSLGDHSGINGELYGKEPDFLSPMLDSPDWWIYQPGELNCLQQPAIYIVDHATGRKRLPEDFNIGVTFLAQLAGYVGMFDSDISFCPDKSDSKK